MNEDDLHRLNINRAAQVIMRYEGALGAQVYYPAVTCLLYIFSIACSSYMRLSYAASFVSPVV